MTGNVSSAYRFDLFEPSTKGQVNGTAAPKIKQPVKPHLVPKKPRSKSAVIREEKAARVYTVKILVVSVVMLLLVGSLIFGRVKIMEINAETEALAAQYKEAQSENVRLESEVKAMYSINNISTYAEEKLGMIKKDCYQVNYFSVDDAEQGD